MRFNYLARETNKNVLEVELLNYMRKAGTKYVQGQTGILIMIVLCLIDKWLRIF